MLRELMELMALSVVWNNGAQDAVAAHGHQRRHLLLAHHLQRRGGRGTRGHGHCWRRQLHEHVRGTPSSCRRSVSFLPHPLVMGWFPMW